MKKLYYLISLMLVGADWMVSDLDWNFINHNEGTQPRKNTGYNMK